MRGGWGTALGFLLLGCGPVVGGGEVGHGVLLLVVDGLRADHLSQHGYDRRTMPRLAELAHEGWYVEHTFAAAPQLIPSHAAILTGSDPNLARRDVPQWLGASPEQAWRLGPELPRMSVEFLLHGFATAAFTDHEDLSPVYGFDAGFQDFEPLWRRELTPSPGMERAAHRLRQWVRSLGRERSWFAYVHLHDLERLWAAPDPRWDTTFPPRAGLAHVPPVGADEAALFAIPPSRWMGGSMTLGEYEARYDGALRRLDTELARLLADLAEDGRLEHTTVVVVGSFGVQFGEAGLLLRAGRLSLADLAVPFVVRPAPALGQPFQAGRLSGIASTLDVAPTLLELAGVPHPESMHGLSLFHAARRGEPSPREVAFASSGIQAGYAAFTRERALEVLLPSLAVHPRLVSAWYGDQEVRGEVASERFYDWRAEPFPPLDAAPRFPAEDSLPIKEAALRWTDAVEWRRVHERAAGVRR